MSSLKIIVPQIRTDLAVLYEPFLKDVFAKYEINTLARQAAVLANICHESAFLANMIENLNYSERRLLVLFPRYFNRVTAAQYAGKPVAIANRVYANRMGNGDERSGDGWKFRGRTAIHLTGKEQYELVEKELGIKCVNDPDVLLKPENVCLVAGWYWNRNKLNALADTFKFMQIVKRINGGYNGIDERIKIYESILDNGLVL